MHAHHLIAVAALVAVVAPTPVPRSEAQDLGVDRPAFRADVGLVAVSAAVRDRRGRAVRGLSAHDFEVFDNGTPRPIVEFVGDGEGAVTLGILLDVSGSMRVGRADAAARRLIDLLLSRLDAGRDEAALFAFDRTLVESQAFTTDLDAIRDAAARLPSAGQTSVFDAIADATARLKAHPSARRALIVLTDGVDTSSRLDPAVVASVAAQSDVPVHIVTLVSPLDQPDPRWAVGGPAAVRASGPLGLLAWWSGANLYVVSTAAEAERAASQVVAELRHLYLFAFEAEGAPGWRALEIRVRGGQHEVRARSGFYRTVPTRG